MAKIIKAKYPTFNPTTDPNAVLERVEATLSTAMEELRLAWGIRGPAANETAPAPERIARGTSDVANEAALAVAQVAPAPAPEPTLRDRIEEVLRGASLELPALARAVGEPVGRVTAEMRGLIRAGAVSNVGLAEHPIWTWKIGDSTTPAELNATVLRLISERPMSTRDLTQATGARFTRVGGAVVAIQRSGRQILNLGHGRAGMWFVVSENARDARLATKPKK